MPLFTSSLYRNFGIGFILGGIATAALNPALGTAVLGILA
ncbi:hypothetical protein MTsN3n11_02240 [Qipengyuania sp. MTN3-11]